MKWKKMKERERECFWWCEREGCEKDSRKQFQAGRGRLSLKKISRFSNQNQIRDKFEVFCNVELVRVYNAEKLT